MLIEEQLGANDRHVIPLGRLQVNEWNLKVTNSQISSRNTDCDDTLRINCEYSAGICDAERNRHKKD